MKSLVDNDEVNGDILWDSYLFLGIYSRHYIGILLYVILVVIVSNVGDWIHILVCDLS